MTGSIVHADSVAEPAAAGSAQPATVTRTRVTLLCAEGLRQFVLEDVDSVQVTDPALRGRVAAAVAAARGEPGSNQRHILLRSNGTGQRTLRVGYVVAAPLWKASYRLVLPDQAGHKARLQGWAVLENQTARDWDGVALTLQYGNPVTFHQAIYRSYFVARPEVPVEILGRILPDVDTKARVATLNGTQRAVPPAGFAGMPAPAPAAAMPASVPMQLAAPAETAATAEAAEETTFGIPSTLTLAAGHTASVPIIDRELPAELVDVAVGTEKHPRAAVRITNDTGSSIPAGVLALYDLSSAAGFAGDARLGGLPPGESRLLEFAQDLHTTVERVNDTPQQGFVSLSAANGILHITLRQRELQHITLSAPDNEPRRVLVVIPRAGDQTLALEGGTLAGAEETATAWRIPVTLAAHETRTLVAYVDRLVRENTALLSQLASDDPVLLRLVNEQLLTAPARAALQRVLALRADEATRHAAAAELQQQLDAVTRDEDRLRKNLDAVGGNDALHGRLTRALDADETRIEQLTQSLAQANAAADKAHQTLADAVTALRL
jgi:hypothetical protein